jgi:hypothetical protein
MSGNNGWVKLHRKSVESGVFSDEKLWKVWTWCLMRATHKAIDVKMSTGRGEIIVHLKPGQFAFGRNQAAKELGMPASTVWRKIVDRHNARKLDIHTDRHYSVITICNWRKYQLDENDDGQASGQAYGQASRTHTRRGEEKGGLLPLGTSEDNYTSETSGTLALDTKKRNERFEIFWKAYPKKRSKGQAERTWKKIDPDDALLETILAGIERAKASHEWTKDGGEFIPYPSTWLNAKGWEDEHEHEPGRTRRTSTGAKPGMEPSKSFDGWDELFGKR